jgi:hypothetical protein
MLFLEGIVTLVCFVLLLIVLLMAEEKLRVLSLLVTFLSAMNAILLAYSMTGGPEVSYLHWFSLTEDQTVLYFRLSVLISLISFTIYTYLSYYPRE